LIWLLFVVGVVIVALVLLVVVVGLTSTVALNGSEFALNGSEAGFKVVHSCLGRDDAEPKLGWIG